MEPALKINILLVDDRPENLLALEACLESPAYNIIRARSSNEALKCILNHDFAVILLDVQMPDLDGFETAKLIKARERSRQTPIIFMSAFYRAHDDIFRGYSVGAVDYLFTPYQPEIVRSKVAVFAELFDKSEQIRRQAQMLNPNERRRRYRNLAEAMPHIVWTARPDGPVDHLNKRWRDYTGMPFERSKGWRWMEAIHPDDLQKCIEDLAQSILLGRECEMRCRLRRNDGLYQWHLLQTVPEKNLKGELMGWFGTAIDIHSQKQWEESRGEKIESSR